MHASLAGVVMGTAVVATATASELAIPPLFSDDMVLQRDQPIVIWGSAEPGSAVTVSLAGDRASAKSDDAGEWEVRLPALEAGGPHDVVIESGDERVELGNVLIGDVWVCSGQSNMYWSLLRTDRGPEFLESDGPDGVRLLRMKKVWSRSAEMEAETDGWRESTPSSMKWFSAVGYHFGRLLHEETGVPVGLITTAWGGTPLEAWTPLPVFEADPVFYADRLDSLTEYDVDDTTAERMIAEAQALHADFVEMAWREDVGLLNEWDKPGYDDSLWPEVEIPGYIDGELGSFNGIVWLRRTFELDHDAGGGEVALGRIDDFDTVFINGEFIGRTSVDQGDGRQIERLYTVPEGVLREGENTIAIALMDVRSSGGVTPDGKPFELRAGSGSDSETVPLGGMWKYQVGFNDRDFGRFPLPGNYAVPVGRAFRRPAALYNAMIHPLTRMGVAGAIWYQGESNAGRGDEYRRMFPEMIAAWRGAWSSGRQKPGYGLPFYFVQLPNYRAAVEEPGESSWAELREAQRLTDLVSPNTGMAITIDIGDPGDIHPTNKLPVSQRLARLALRDVYGIGEGEVTGPHPVSVRIDGGRVRIAFEHASGLHAVGGPVKGFALSGEDGVFRWADARIDGGEVVVACPDVPDPVRVRYGWADNPGCNLFNGDGLPATPFEMAVE